MIKFKDPTVFAFPFYVKHFSTFCVGTFPARLVTMMEGWANGVSIFRATQNLPTRLFSFLILGHNLPFLQKRPTG